MHALDEGSLSAARVFAGSGVPNSSFAIRLRPEDEYSALQKQSSFLKSVAQNYLFVLRGVSSLMLSSQTNVSPCSITEFFAAFTFSIFHELAVHSECYCQVSLKSFYRIKCPIAFLQRFNWWAFFFCICKISHNYRVFATTQHNTWKMRTKETSVFIAFLCH